LGSAIQALSERLLFANDDGPSAGTAMAPFGAKPAATMDWQRLLFAALPPQNSNAFLKTTVVGTPPPPDKYDPNPLSGELAEFFAQPYAWQ
jgi:hypothetical protein